MPQNSFFCPLDSRRRSYPLDLSVGNVGWAEKEFSWHVTRPTKSVPASVRRKNFTVFDLSHTAHPRLPCAYTTVSTNDGKRVWASLWTASPLRNSALARGKVLSADRTRQGRYSSRSAVSTHALWLTAIVCAVCCLTNRESNRALYPYSGQNAFIPCPQPAVQY